MSDHHEPAGIAAVRRRLYETFRDWADPNLSRDDALTLYGQDWLWRLSRQVPSGSWLDDAVDAWVEDRDAARVVNDVLGFEDGPISDLQTILERLDPQLGVGLDIG